MQHARTNPCWSRYIDVNGALHAGRVVGAAWARRNKPRLSPTMTVAPWAPSVPSSSGPEQRLEVIGGHQEHPPDEVHVNRTKQSL